MRSVVIAVVAAVLVMGFCLEASATVPRLVNYQGILNDSGGLPVDGPHSLTFKIYADSAQGAPVLWAEVHSGVSVDDGLFNVILGGTTAIPDSLFGATPRWMGITVDTDGEMTPRMQLTSVPWAFRAALAESSAALPSHTHDDRYYTETELNSPGTINTLSNPVDWTELKSVPAGFADGTDDIGGGTNGWVVSGDNEQSNVPGNVGIGTAPSANLRLHVVNPADTMNATAVYGEVSSTGSTAFHDGVWGVTRSQGTGAGVFGQATSTTTGSSANGVAGSTSCPTGRGVQGGASNSLGVNYGVSGYTASPNGYAGFFQGQPTGFSGYFLGGKNYFEGNVGIGTAAPAAKLDVAGTVKMTGFKMPTDAATNYVLTSDSVGVGTWQAATGGATGWTITNGGNDEYASVPGNVGIGTTAPIARLEVSDAQANHVGIYAHSSGMGAAALTAVSQFGVGVDAACTGDDEGSIAIRGQAAQWNQYAGFFQGGKNYFEGNVGIGTTTPAYKLDVVGDSRISGNVGIGTSTPYSKLDVLNSLAVSPAIAIHGVSSDAGTAAVHYGVEGETRSTGTSDVAGVRGWASATSGGADGVDGWTDAPSGTGVKGIAANASGGVGVMGGAVSDSGYAGYFAGRTYFQGNVGIGTASPRYKLDVVGDSRINGYMTLSTSGPIATWPWIKLYVENTSPPSTDPPYPARGIVAKTTYGGDVGSSFGIIGEASGQPTSGWKCAGVYGLVNGASGQAIGVYGESYGSEGTGIRAVAHGANELRLLYHGAQELSRR